MSAASAGSSVRFHAPWYDEREIEAIRAGLAKHTTGDGPIGRKKDVPKATLVAGVPAHVARRIA